MYYLYFFFFNDTATTEIYTLSLHDALPISRRGKPGEGGGEGSRPLCSANDRQVPWARGRGGRRSEEHTSELQSRLHLVCRLLLEKKKTKIYVSIQRTLLSSTYRSLRRVGRC